MVRRSPCEKYIKYLITHPDNYPDDHIKKLLDAQQLDYIGLPYLKYLRLTCVPPIPFYPDDETHRPSQRFLRKEEIEDIYLPDDTMKTANKLLDTPQAKEIIESLLITKAVPAWIHAALRRNGIASTPDAIRRYKHYYFDLGLVDERELRQIMNVRAIPEPTEDATEQKLNSQLLYAHRMDSRSILSKMSSSPMASLMNVMRMGIIPNNLNVAKIARAARAISAVGVVDCALQGKTEMARDYAITAKMMSDMLEQVGEVEEDLQEGLARIALATDSREVPHIKELTDGEHTLDVEPLEAIDLEEEITNEQRSRRKTNNTG